MKRSDTHILTTHTGSLPRDEQIRPFLEARERGEEIDASAFDATTRRVVGETVARQVALGLDVVGDGEQGKPSYVTYLIDRIEGFGGERRRHFPKRLDSADFPNWARHYAPRGLADLRVPTCSGPLAWKRFDLVEADLAVLREAIDASTPTEVFMTAASPGVVSTFLPNDYYANDRDYVEALAEVLTREYEAIVRAGFVLQIDCPDLAMSRHSEYSERTLDEIKDVATMHVEILNGALANIPPDRMRMHVCWGNYEGPHNHDVALEEIAPIVLRARPAGLVLEGSNPRHGHDWALWREVELPPDMLIVTGCIDTTTNFVEHPALVRDRIVKLAEVVGRERVIAGTDCGFGTMMGLRGVDPDVAWAKLESLVAGARLASEILW